MIAHGDAGDVRADLDDFARGFVTERRVPLAWRDAADGDVERVGAADATGAHPDEHVAGTGLRAVGIQDFGLARAGDRGAFMEAFTACPPVRCRRYRGIRRTPA